MVKSYHIVAQFCLQHGFPTAVVFQVGHALYQYIKSTLQEFLLNITVKKQLIMFNEHAMLCITPVQRYCKANNLAGSKINQ